MSPLIVDREQVRLHLRLLNKPAKTARYRAIWPDRKAKVPGRTQELTAANVEAAVSQGFNSYIVIGHGGDSDAEIQHLPALFGEWDNGDIAWQMSAWSDVGLPQPSFQVLTGGKSVHHYWVFTAPVAVEPWVEMQARLIHLAGFDTTNRNPSRVMRLAGCPHQTTGRMAEIVNVTGELYDPQGMMAYLPPITPPPSLPPEPRGDASRPLDEVWAALSKIPPRPGHGSGTYAEYRNILWGLIAAVEEAGGTREQAISAMAAHSPEGWDVVQVARSGGQRIKAGTFWWHAQEYGHKLRRPEPVPLPQAAQAAIEVGRSDAASDDPWAALPSGFNPAKDGTPRMSAIGTFDLVGLIRSRYRGVLWTNEMTGSIMYGAEPLPGVELQIAYSRLEGHGYKISKENAKTAILQAAWSDKRHPIREYLNGCLTPLPEADWADIANFLLGPGHSPTDSSALRKWLIFAVARVFQPGCPFGIVLILAGGQQLHKTRFFNTLASDRWFLGGFQKSRNDTDDLISLHRNWICEMGELDGGLTKHSNAEMKAMVDRKEDTLRRPYSPDHETCPRGFVLCGTTNKTDGFFTDETGNRRYYVLDVLQRIDSVRLEGLRDAIWASAVRDYRNGATWFLTQDELDTSNARNRELLIDDPWEYKVEEILADQSALGILELDIHRQFVVRMDRVIEKIEPTLARVTQQHRERMKRIMRKLGWESVEIRLMMDRTGRNRKVWKMPQGGGYSQGGTAAVPPEAVVPPAVPPGRE